MAKLRLKDLTMKKWLALAGGLSCGLLAVSLWSVRPAAHWQSDVEALYRDFDHQESLACNSIMGKMLDIARSAGKRQEFGDWLEAEAEARRQEVTVELRAPAASAEDEKVRQRKLRRLEHLYITLMIVRRSGDPEGLIPALCGMGAVDLLRKNQQAAREHFRLASALVKGNRDRDDGPPLERAARVVTSLTRPYY